MSTDLKDVRAAALKTAQDIVNGAKASSRELTDDERTAVSAKMAEIEALDVKIKAAKDSADLMARLGAAGQRADEKSGNDGQARSLGEWFVKNCAQQLADAKGMKGASVAAPEFKAATDTHVTTGAAMTPLLTEYDRTIVQAVRPRLTIADLLGQGTLSGNAISYLVEGALEGAYTTVAEAGAKPQLHIVDPTWQTDSLKKIAGFIKLSDEMIEDLDFLVSEIDGRLRYELARFEETQILNGNGTGSNVLGLLNRSGIQTETRGTAASGDTAADTIFRAITKVSTGAGLDADGIVVHPLDYQALRLQKDSNGQYFGGGFFAGQYGSGTLQDQPPLWGLRTIVTAAIAQGTALVGAFSQAATLYRKGGVRVESTNSHASDFTSNLVTVRAEERVGLAVRRPAGLVKATLTPAE